MKCLECHVETKPVKIERYYYSECGLKNIYLTDVKAMECPHCNDQEVLLPNIENLHALIAKNIASQASRLKSEEIRFLRVHLGLSGIDFAQAVSVEPETVSIIVSLCCVSYGKLLDEVHGVNPLKSPQSHSLRDLPQATVRRPDANQDIRKIGRPMRAASISPALPVVKES